MDETTFSDLPFGFIETLHWCEGWLVGDLIPCVVIFDPIPMGDPDAVPLWGGLSWATVTAGWALLPA